MPENDDVKAFSNYVELEIAAAAARKSSFETRAFSIITLNLGIFTLFFALQTQLTISVSAYPHGPVTLFVAAVACSLLSMALAAASAFPFKYPFPKKEAFDRRISQVQSGKTSRHQIDILKLRVRQLDVYTSKNQVKGYLLYVAIVFLGVAACLMIATLSWTLLIGPQTQEKAPNIPLTTLSQLS